MLSSRSFADSTTGGDAIVAVDGKRVHDSADLTNFVAQRNPGQKVVLDVYRGGARRNVTVTLAQRPDKPSPPGGK